MTRSACALLFALALCACSKPAAPDREQPPEPQASAPATATPAAVATAPLDRAKGVPATLDAAHGQRDAALDASSGAESQGTAAP